MLKPELLSPSDIDSWGRTRQQLSKMENYKSWGRTRQQLSKVENYIQIKAMSVVKKDKSGKENPEWGGAWLTFSQGTFPKGLFMKKNGTHVPSLCEVMVCTFPKD